MEDNLFIETLLQKSKARREFMNKTKKCVSIERKRSVLIDEQQMNAEISLEKSPKRQCTQASQAVYLPDEENFHVPIEKSDVTFTSFHFEYKVGGLTALKKSCFGGNKSALEQKSIDDNTEPAELPLSAKKALFENAFLGGVSKIIENVVVPKVLVARRTAMFENASKVSQFSKFDNCGSKQMKNPVKFPSSISIKSPVKIVQAVSTISNVKDFTLPHSNLTLFKINSQETQDDRNLVSPPIALILSPNKSNGNHREFIQQDLIEKFPSNVQGKEIATKATEESQQEICDSVNCSEKLSSSSVENSSEMEQNALSSEEQYSCELNAVPELSECDKYNSDDDNEYMEDKHEQKVSSKCYNEESDMDESVFNLHDVNEIESSVSLESNYSDELNNSSKQDGSLISSQHTKNASSSQNYSSISSYSDDSSYNASKSQSFTSSSSVSSYDVASIKPNESTPSIFRQNKNPEVPLLYTVSFYRKQKQETRVTPVRTIIRRVSIDSSDSPDTDYTQSIQDRIKVFQDEILKEQTIISQASQALNFCNATVEFSGSNEQVEGERLLLIATQKRQACLNEIQYLKTCDSQCENFTDGEGTLTITDMQLPLKKQFIASQLDGKKSMDDDVHYFLCLIRHGAQVIGTHMVSTNDKVSDGALCFTNHIKLQNLFADFSVVFEVYSLQTKKDVLSHEKKYRTKREHSKNSLTLKSKKSSDKMLMPAISSPGGPNAVRSSSFGVVGFTCITLQNCNQKTFTLNNVLFASPVDGVLKVKLELHVEHNIMAKGFLTMFEDVSDFGAWYRRWCVLNVHLLAYWRYPDDEHKEEPVGVIDLKQCVTGEVKLISRDICARPHTFQLDTVRPQEKDDKDTLISRICNTLTSTKYLLAADTKEERILWCNKLNKTLTNVRKWNSQALRPIKSMDA